MSKIPYDKIDIEIVALCRALNDIEGVETVESCCGHNKEKCRIYFKVSDIQTFNKLLFHCFNHEDFWDICADTSDPHRDWNDLHFVLTSKRICKQSDFGELGVRIAQRTKDMKMSDNEWAITKYLKNEDKIVNEVISRENKKFYIC